MTFVVFAGNPGVTAADLALFLGLDGIDTPRADLLIQVAAARVARYLRLDPTADLPDGTAGPVLSAAGRGYTNPTSVTAQMAGPFQMSGGTGGVYLTADERRDLRQLRGSGAFSVDLLPGYPDAQFPDDAP